MGEGGWKKGGSRAWLRSRELAIVVGWFLRGDVAKPCDEEEDVFVCGLELGAPLVGVPVVVEEDLYLEKTRSWASRIKSINWLLSCSSRGCVLLFTTSSSEALKTRGNSRRQYSS